MRRFWAAWVLFAPALAFGVGAPGPTPPSWSVGAMHGAFIQSKTVPGLSQPLVSRGDFSLAPAKGLVWRTTEPLKVTVVLTPAGVFALDGDSVQRLTAGAEPLELMRQILAGDAGALGKVFVVRRDRTPRGWRMTLTPKPGALAGVFKSIEAEGGAFAVAARLRERSGDETSLRFSAVRAGLGLLDKTEESLLGL